MLKVVGAVGIEPTTKRLCSHYCFRNIFRLCELDYLFILRLVLKDVCRLVSTPARQGEIGSGLPFKASPNLTDYHLKITFQVALQDHSCCANGYE